MFGLSNFAWGANQELQRVLAEKFMQQVQRQKLAQAQQELDQQQRRDATAQEVAFGRLGLDRDELSQRNQQFNTTAGFKDRELKLDEGMQPVRIKHTEAQTSELARKPQAEAADRQHDFDLEAKRHGNRVAQISVDASEQRKTDALRLRHQSQPKEASAQDAYRDERTTRVRESVAALKQKVGALTAGAGSLLGNVPGTQARNFRAELDTLKSNIAFGELTEMRAASKTGGALGQVSDKEMTLLQSALGALDQGQSPENLKAQLEKIEQSLARWEAAKAGNAAPAQGASKGTFRVLGEIK